jgi:hypothetical protein
MSPAVFFRVGVGFLSWLPFCDQSGFEERTPIYRRGSIFQQVQQVQQCYIRPKSVSSLSLSSHTHTHTHTHKVSVTISFPRKHNTLKRLTMKLLKSTLRVTFLSILLPVVKAQGNNDDACTLNCPLDAPCVFGEITTTRLGSTTYITASDDASSSTTKRQQHCACPPGWTGIMCDTKYESCSSVDKCFHGGKCVAGAAVDEFGNSQLVCDCSTAQSTTKYVGKYCEHAMEQQCDVQNPDLFCVNGGECNPDVAYVTTIVRLPNCPSLYLITTGTFSTILQVRWHSLSLSRWISWSSL